LILSGAASEPVPYEARACAVARTPADPHRAVTCLAIS
jgi:hypothetical protein